MKAEQSTSQPSPWADVPVRPIDLSEGKPLKDEDLDKVLGGIKPPQVHKPTTNNTHN
ncbi:hypothetical protein [Propionivibrio sp.]|uniref:hypothetical protein n=1 Tax=Propionivibrio sp. TaxID=2212460 RepID=UPI003BF34050